MTTQKQNERNQVIWILWRQDDNGHKFQIESFTDLTAAESAKSEFESHHHKQIYWLEEASEIIRPKS